MWCGFHASQDRHHARVRVGDDFERHLFELHGLAAHQVGTQADRSCIDHCDRKQRLGLVPLRSTDDLSRRPKVEAARLVEEARMTVPITDVVDSKPSMQVVEEDLLPARVGAEANHRPLRTGPGGDREGNDIRVPMETTGQHTAYFRVGVAETVGNDGRVCARSEDEAATHQNCSPVRAQFR